jgi:protein Tex
MSLNHWFKEKCEGIALPSIEAVLRLTAEGATLPFIARYRKEATGNLDEVQIQKVLDSKESYDQITHRQKYILEEIERQGKLTDELRGRILSTFQATELEDLYLPYKVKKKSKATLAKEAGLTELAEWIWEVGHGLRQPEPGQTLAIWAFSFKNEEKNFPDAEKCIQGATDILIERLSENSTLRQKVREGIFERASLVTGKAEKAKPNSKYESYFSYHEKLTALQRPEHSHRYLAIRRGWMEEELTLSIEGGPADPTLETDLQSLFENEACTVRDSEGAEVLMKAAKMAFKAHVLSSIQNEAHKAMKDIADAEAIKVFSENLKKLLLASPFGPKAVLGVDPGIRTGCKLAVINASGKFIADTVVHLQSEDQKNQAKDLIKGIIGTGEIRAIAVGNGTAGRETETFFRQTLKEAGFDVPVVMVNESGASVYSASEVAREEFPDLDLTVRGAISIARRLQDPLAELVKVDPKSIGVGQYQHDVSPNAMKKSLDLVVDVCVNSVGVNLNTASHHLLRRISGIGESLAKAIVEYRNEKGIFKSREDLRNVPRFSVKTFEQAAGFLRVPESENPLDNTSVHPERYSLLEEAAKGAGKTVKDLMGRDGVALLKEDKALKDKLGDLTFQDILGELEKPGRDPRDQFVPFSYREDISELKDVKVDMICPGIVTNVTNFGAFVDIGVHQDGLVHISQLSNTFIKDPREVVNPGDRVMVKVLEVNLEKTQMALSIKGASEQPKPERKSRAEQAARAPKREREDAPKKAPAYTGPKRSIEKKNVATGETPMENRIGAVRAEDRNKPSPSSAGQKRPGAGFGPARPQFSNNAFASAFANLKAPEKK